VITEKRGTRVFLYINVTCKTSFSLTPWFVLRHIQGELEGRKLHNGINLQSIHRLLKNM
jgi:hypothetical protein